MDVREPTIVTDGGPWADHDMPCAVCQRNHAVLELHVGHFAPCWECRADGYLLVRAQGRITRRLAIRMADVTQWGRTRSWWQR